MAVVYLVAGLVAILDEGGLSTKLVAADERDPARLSVVFWQELIVGVAFGTIVVTLAHPFEVLFAQTDLRAFLYALAPMFAITAPRRYAQTILFRDYRFRGMGIARIIGAVVFVGTTVALASSGYGVWSLVWGLVTRMTIESVGFVVAAWDRLAVRAPPLGSLRSGYGRSGVAKVGERILAYGIDRVDLLVIGQVLGPTALGVYDVFKRLSIGFYQQVVPAFSRVAMPHLARLRDRPMVLAQAYARQLRYICLLLFPAYVFQAVFATDLIAVIFGLEWVRYAPVFTWISLMLLVRSVNGPIDALLMARGWIRRELAYSVAAMGAVAGALLYAAGEGLEAAIVAVTTINLAMCVPVYLWIVRPAGYVGRRQYVAAVGPPFCLAATAVGMSYATVQLIGGRPATRLVCGVAIAIGIFGSGVLAVYPSARLRTRALLRDRGGRPV